MEPTLEYASLRGNHPTRGLLDHLATEARIRPYGLEEGTPRKILQKKRTGRTEKPAIDRKTKAGEKDRTHAVHSGLLVRTGNPGRRQLKRKLKLLEEI